MRTINLHATAGGAYRQRRRQGTPDLRSAQLAEAIAAACAPFDGTVVLAGDFNCTPDSAPWVAERLRDAGFGDAGAGLSRGTWDPDNPLNRGRGSGVARTVDYIYARAAAATGPPRSRKPASSSTSRWCPPARCPSRTTTASSPSSTPPEGGESQAALASRLTDFSIALPASRLATSSS